MRRTAEWLLLPLFLLPLGIGLAFHVWAQADYGAALRRYETQGPALASAWLSEGGPAEDLPQRFMSEHGRTLRHLSGRDGKLGMGARVTFGDRAGVVGLPQHCRQISREWNFAESFPVGLVPAALADPQVRLAVETGRPDAMAPGLDEATVVFSELLDAPEMRRLARAPLPAATKLYLVQRWRRQGVTVPQLEAIEKGLRFLARVEQFLLAHAGPFATGTHVAEGVQVLADPPRELLFAQIHPGTRQVAPESSSIGASDDLVTLQFLGAYVARPSADLLWQGRLESPLAGQWAFSRRFGTSWTSVPRYRRWIGPGAAFLVALLLIPAALLVSLRRRRRLDEARSRFINELAHDLRTPLTSLRLYAEMLERKSTGDEERDRYASVLTRESARVTALLGNLLDLSRLEDGRRHLDVGTVDVAQVAAQAAGDFERLFPARGNDLRLTGDEDVHARADAAALARCLANLLDNAGKYTEPGTPIRVDWRDEGEMVRIAVRDDGPGIPSAERAGAFERYARGARAKRDGLPGTGLGLSLVKELIVEMGGSVRLGSPRSGTEIEMRLPRGTR